MNKVNFIGHNIKTYWGLIWEINGKLLVVSQGIMGGIFLYIIREDGETMLTWPGTYHKDILLTQLNFLADRILSDSVGSVKSVPGKKGFLPKLPEPIDIEDKDTRTAICEQMTEWIEATFPGPNWNYWSNNYIYIPDFDEVELQRVWKLITNQHVVDYKPLSDYKPKEKARKEYEEKDADEIYKEMTEGVEGDHDEWVQQFEKGEGDED